jgi:hypothetical protein
MGDHPQQAHVDQSLHGNVDSFSMLQLSSDCRRRPEIGLQLLHALAHPQLSEQAYVTQLVLSQTCQTAVNHADCLLPPMQM